MSDLQTMEIRRNLLRAAVDQAMQRNNDYPHAAVHVPDALEAIERCLILGEATHEPFDWRELGIAGNFDRAERHGALVNKTSGENHGTYSDDQLVHTICRALFALQLREEQRCRQNEK